jgi:hypothetical protein
MASFHKCSYGPPGLVKTGIIARYTVYKLYIPCLRLTAESAVICSVCSTFSGDVTVKLGW